MAEVALVTDSTSSLGPGQAEVAGVVVVPLQVVVDGRSRLETEVGPGEVAAALRSGRSVSTSRPGPGAFSTAYADLAGRGAAAVVSVHLSADMSGTCAAAERAAAAAPLPVTVVDCRTVAMAAGFAVLAGAAAAEAGASAAEVVRLVRDRAAAGTTYFSLATLEFLRRGGRIGPAAAVLGSALAVKALLTVRDGRIQPYERVRTASRAEARLAELGRSAVEQALVSHGRRPEVAVHHLDDPAGAARLVDALRPATGGGAITVSEVSAVVGVHAGPGLLGVVVSPVG